MPDKHKLLLWMVYYNNSCQIHESSKDSVGWYLRKSRKTLNMINKRVTVKSEKEIFKLLINKEFEEKVKKIKRLYKEAKKITNWIKYEKEEELKLNLEFNELADPDGESVMKI